jgi:hypothetical protein
MKLNDVPTPITPGQNWITLMYDYNNVLRTVTYQLDGTRTLMRNGDPILDNVTVLNFLYGVDQNTADNVWAVTDWVDATGVGTSRVVAVRVTLTASPQSANPDVQQMVSPRTLTSRVALRNLCMR